MRVAAEQSVGREETIALYEAVGWTAYTADPDALLRSVARSHLVLTVRDADGTLIGLARTVSDGATVCYVQDLLVRPDRQHAGIGRALLDAVRRAYAGCRQLVLVTDRDGPLDFYRAAGFTPLDELGLVGFIVAP